MDETTQPNEDAPITPEEAERVFGRLYDAIEGKLRRLTHEELIQRVMLDMKMGYYTPPLYPYAHKDGPVLWIGDKRMGAIPRDALNAEVPDAPPTDQ